MRRGAVFPSRRPRHRREGTHAVADDNSTRHHIDVLFAAECPLPGARKRPPGAARGCRCRPPWRLRSSARVALPEGVPGVIAAAGRACPRAARCDFHYADLLARVSRVRPFFRSPASTATSTAFAPPRCPGTKPRGSSRTPSPPSMQQPGGGACRSVASLACSAIVQQFFRGRSARSPGASTRARRLASPQVKPARDPAHQAIEGTCPPGRVYAMASGHREIIKGRHNPRRSDGGRPVSTAVAP